MYNHIGNLPDVLILSTDKIHNWFEKFRLELNVRKFFDFDDPYCLTDTDYYNITGIKKGNYFNFIFETLQIFYYS